MTRSTCLGVVSLLLSTLHVPQAFAGEDGGTASVFAEPISPRALGMGGAYTAAGDDATAWMWNPATLAQVGRAELLLGAARPTVLDYREQIASVAVPNWRWGTLALSWRQFGIDGIDVRDERNVLLVQDQSDRQSEMALGYARMVNESWGIGLSARLRSLELVGRRASSLGADFGLVVRSSGLMSSPPAWLEDVVVGASIQNLIRPSMQLDIDDVPDLRSGRVGVAWRPLGSGRMPCLVALDVHKSDGRSLRMHTGVEFGLHRSLDLRAGMNDGNLTAGTGLRRGNLSVDYAFEDGPLAATHRAAVSLRFGATVAEGRLAAQRARDDELQARLSNAFESRRQERITSLLDQATTARQQGDLETALGYIATLQALEPDDSSATALEAACTLDRAQQVEAAGDTTGAAVLFTRVLALAPEDRAAADGVARCRSVGDRRATRNAEIRKMFDEALEAFVNDDLAAARRRFADILALTPDDQETRAMLQRTEQGVDRRIAQFLDQAKRFATAGLIDAERDFLERARALDPASARLARFKTAQARVRESRDQARVTVSTPRQAESSPSRRPALSRLEQREVSEYYRSAQASLRRGARGDAIRLLELVWSRDPSYGDVGVLLVREYQTLGMDAFAAGRLEESIAQWENALRFDPENERTRAYLSRARMSLARSQELSSR